ncbi:hypothetical protein HY622_03865 [Candidatus Uhrbacteria bacterium]|nr:hypothetical protein [Candidatus Uhrbacteria bacterium]
MQKMNQTIVGVVALVVVVAAVWAFLGFQKNGEFRNKYSVVYLSSGELYVAKLSVFPKLVMTDPYLLLLVQNAENKSNNFQLTPLNESVWAPTKLYLKPEQVLYYGPLDESSKVLETLRNAGK